MGNLYLVRHGQASFGAADYDNLSELGHRQSVRLGEYFAKNGVQFEAALTGTLKRHAQTLEGIGQGSGNTLAPLVWPGLDEYDSAAVIATVHPHPIEKADTPELYRTYFRLLCNGLTQWMDGVVSPKGMPTYEAFVHGVTSALDLPRLVGFDYRLYPVVDQIADKVCATMHRYGDRPSSREKDLVDLVVLAVTHDIDGTALSMAIATETRRRRMDPIERFVVPAEWGAAYSKMARTVPYCADVLRIDAASDLVAALIDPALDDTADGLTWHHAELAWSPAPASPG